MRRESEGGDDVCADYSVCGGWWLMSKDEERGGRGGRGWMEVVSESRYIQKDRPDDRPASNKLSEKYKTIDTVEEPRRERGRGRGPC